MNILVTGSDGYMGVAATKYLPSKGHRVVSIRGPRGGGPDLRDSAQVSQMLSTHQPDMIFHCAAMTAKAAREHVGDDLAADLHGANVESTRNLVASADGIPIILMSSAEVYRHHTFADYPDGISEKGPLIEDAGTPQARFAVSLLEREELVLEAGGVVLRFNNAYGNILIPNAPIRYLIDSAAECFLLKREFKLGNPNGGRNYMDVREIANAVDWVIGSHLSSIVLNIAGPQYMTNGHAVTELAARLGTMSLLDAPDSQGAPGDASESLNLSTSLSEQLGWKAAFTFEHFLDAVAGDVENITAGLELR